MTWDLIILRPSAENTKPDGFEKEVDFASLTVAEEMLSK
jgi:hypothetical protein